MNEVQKILKMLDNLQSYEETKIYIREIQQNAHSVFVPICETIKIAFQLKAPVQSVQAGRLGKEAVETKNPDFLEVFQNICLPMYEIVGEFRKEDQSDERGEYYFPYDHEDYGKSFLRLVLEGIEVWAKLYPVKDGLPTKFYLTYSRLLTKGVKFPAYHYYKPAEVINQRSPLFIYPYVQSNKSVQDLMTAFQDLKLKLNQQAMQKQTTNYIYIKSLKSIIEQIQYIDGEINIRMKQSLDDGSSQELSTVQGEIQVILNKYNQLEKGQLSVEEYAKTKIKQKHLNIELKLQEKEKQLMDCIQENQLLKQRLQEYEEKFQILLHELEMCKKQSI